MLTSYVGQRLSSEGYSDSRVSQEIVDSVENPCAVKVQKTENIEYPLEAYFYY